VRARLRARGGEGKLRRLEGAQTRERPPRELSVRPRLAAFLAGDNGIVHIISKHVFPVAPSPTTTSLMVSMSAALSDIFKRTQALLVHHLQGPTNATLAAHN